MLVLEILNEPRNKVTKDILNELIDSAYTIIREKNPKKTIMFNPNEFGKFYRMGEMKLPKDGNIIISGHYYELYTFTHQGSHGQKCGKTTWGTSADKLLITSHFRAYRDTAMKYFPDINGGHVPLNNGEFGVSGLRTGFGDDPSCQATALFPELTADEINMLSNAEIAARAFPSDEERGQWTKAVIEATDNLNMSWHYWGFNRVGGYEVYDKGTKSWFAPVLKALIPNSPLLP